MDLKDTVATNLRRIRHAKGLTQEEMADRIGLSSRYIGSIERGAASPTVTVLGKLAQALAVEPAKLVSPGPSRRRTGPTKTKPTK